MVQRLMRRSIPSTLVKLKYITCKKRPFASPFFENAREKTHDFLKYREIRRGKRIVFLCYILKNGIFLKKIDKILQFFLQRRGSFFIFTT